MHLLLMPTGRITIFTQKLAYSWSKGKGKFPVRPSCSSLENCRQRMTELQAKTERDSNGRKGREQAMSPSSLSLKTDAHAARMTRRLHVSSRPEKVTTCFVLNDCSDDSGILADIDDQNALLPKKSTGRTFLTPTASTASTAVDTGTGSVSDVCVVNNDDEVWLIEPDYKSGWITRFNSGAYQGIPF